MVRLLPYAGATHSHGNRPVFAEISRLVLVFIAYFVAMQIGLRCITTPQNIAYIWPPSGVALAALLLVERRKWVLTLLVISAATILGNYSSGNPLPGSLAMAAANTLEIGLCAWVVERLCGPGVTFVLVKEILALGIVTFGVNGITALSGAIAAGVSFKAPFFSSWLVWWVSNGLGILLITPMIILWKTGVSIFQVRFSSRLGEGGILLAGTLLLSWMILGHFESDYDATFHVYMYFPLIIWSALRFDSQFTVTVVFILAVTVLWNAIGVLIPNQSLEYGIGERFIKMQVFISTSVFTGLALSAVVGERKKTKDRLSESERKYRELVEMANSIILRWTSNGKITFINEFGQRFFGYSAEEILGRYAIGTIVPETETSGRDMSHLIEQIGADPTAFEQNVNENMRRNGERVWVNWTNRIVRDDQGRVAEILSIGTDMTERRRAEEEIRQLHDALQSYATDLERRVAARTSELLAANRKLQDLDRLKSMFIASMSHELRTPLNSIIGFTGMTLQGLSGELNEEQEDNLTRSYRSAKHLLNLITDVIDISKIEAGKIEAFPEEFSLIEMISEAIDTIKSQLKSKRLDLEVDVPVGMTLNTDRKRLLQCLINFLSNGVKFTESGGITITARETDGQLVLSVIDTGIGVADKDIPRLFEAFERLETRIRVKAGGTGLGLYLTRKLASEILHGSVSVASVEGQGSTFTISIPRDLGQVQNAPTRQSGGDVL